MHVGAFLQAEMQVMAWDAPGIGVEFNEEAAAHFPFDPKYPPINRRLDGSAHDW